MNTRVPAALLAIVIGFAALSSPARAQQPGVPPARTGQTLTDAQHLFYNGRFEEASALALTLGAADPANLPVIELRTSALLFELKRELGGDGGDKKKALARCVTCAGLLDSFAADTTKGVSLAKARVKADARDEEALFFLGKLNLNYVWLQLGVLGKKTGWNEYWDARRSLDALLKRNPQHVRARVARAWIDYIVDTRMPWGTAWLLGGGSKKRALTMMREAADAEADFFESAEAAFALWELHVREKRFADAVAVGRGLARDFPGNREVAKFLETHDREAGR